MKATLALLAYNEEAVIERVVREAAAQLRNSFAAGEWEMLVVDDGSRDATGAICDRLADEMESVRVVHHRPNRGYVEATLTALRQSRGDFLCVFDGDGQHDARDVPRLAAKLESGCDVVFGWKRARRDPPARKVLSLGLRLAARYFLRSRLHDINAGCRAFRREHVAQLAVIRHRINFIGPELYTRARLHDLKIGEVVVRHAPRAGGESSHGWQRIPLEVWQALRYLRALRAELRRSGKGSRFLP